MVPGHPSRIALSTSPITSRRISAQPTTLHRLRGERGGRGTTSSRTTTRAANEVSPPKSACAGDTVLRTSTRQRKSDVRDVSGNVSGRGVCLLLQYLLQRCSRGGGGGNGGHVIRETTSRSLCEQVCPSRTNERGVLLVSGVVKTVFWCFKK
jgi:hypothetical protein